jgi:peroxiredoxin
MKESTMSTKKNINAGKKPQHKLNVSKWFTWSAVIIVAVVVYYNLHSSQHQPSTSPVEKGTAPQFTLSDMTGRSVSLSDYRGKVVILDFWATWCPPCKKEIPDFIALQNQYALQGLQIIGVGLDEPSNVASFVQQYGINYPVVVGDDAIANRYGGVSGIPTTFIIDKQGKIRNRYEGFTDRSVFEAEIKKLL